MSQSTTLSIALKGLLNDMLLFPFLHSHLTVVSHCLCKGVLTVFLDKMDAGRPVTVEQKGKQLSDKVVVNLAFLHILVTFSACVKTFLHAAFPYLAP